MLILASASPRRRTLLERLGVSFVVLPSGVEERPPRAAEDPVAYALALARDKSAAISAGHPDDTVLAADTVVTIDGHILGKPASSRDAERMLAMLRARTHLVVTGVSVRCGDVERGGSVSSAVRMHDFSQEDARRYVATGEPMDKAGAYAVQGLGGALVEHVAGCYGTVVGLPLCLTAELLAACGVVPPSPSGPCRCSMAGF